MTTSLFGMYVVNAWLMHTGATTDKLQPGPEFYQKEFYCELKDVLILRVIPTQSRGGVNCAQKNTHRSTSEAR